MGLNLIGDPFAAGASIINGFMSSRAARKANETNLQIARETNENSLKMMREQNQFNYDSAKEFFNMENEYNDPANVRARLENAGYNPFFSENSQMVSSADAATPTASGLPSLAVPHVEPVPPVMNGVLDALLKVGQAKKLGVDTEGAEQEVRNMLIENAWRDFQTSIDKMFYPVEKQSNLNNTDLQNDKLGQELNKIKEEINNLAQDYMNKQKQGEILDIQKVTEEFNKKIAEYNSKSAESDAAYRPKLNQQALENAISEGNNIKANTAQVKKATSLLGKTINGVAMTPKELSAFREQIYASAKSDKAAAEAMEVIYELNKKQNKNKAFQLVKKLKRFVGEIPVLGNMLDALGQSTGKNAGSKFVK